MKPLSIIPEAKIRISPSIGGGSSCCSGDGVAAPADYSRCEELKRIIIGTVASAAGPVPEVTTVWSAADHRGSIKCRLSGFRNNYTVPPGLYAAGKPGPDSEVLVSANYKLSFDILRRELHGRNLWVLVIDTDGINVWCAAGKGTFGTDELVKRLKHHGLEKVVKHRRVIIPQLGAPGVNAAEVKTRTGFHVHYGPVRAGDLPAYLDSGLKASPGMRDVHFGFMDRLVLTPMELLPALKRFPAVVLIILAVMGLTTSGIIFREALLQGWPLVVLALASLMAGAVITPLFLPFLPFRSFAIKGLFTGLAVNALLIHGAGILSDKDIYITAVSWLLFPALSSYLALQFTGATTFTGMSGVEKELKIALPVYIGLAVLSLIALGAYKLTSWGVI